MNFMIDFENVRDRGLDGAIYLTPNDSVTIFYSRASQKISQGKLQEVFNSGCNLSICKLEHTAKNSLDYYIATAVGECYGSGYTGITAIVSNDKGFRAVKDYWQNRSSPARRIVIKPDILQSIVGANENSVRRLEIARLLTESYIEIEFEKYQRKIRKRRDLEKLFEDSSYVDMVEQIMDIVVESESKYKTIYLAFLKQFGRKQGVEIYRMLRRSDCI